MAVRSGTGWSNQVGAGYEVSSKGDKRFSALYARLPDGRIIEDAWGQAKGYADGRAAKGKPALTPDFDYWGTYKGLWQQFADANPQLMTELAQASQGRPLVDRFAKTENNQARALAEILQSMSGVAASSMPEQPAAASVHNPLLFGGAPNRKKLPDGRNSNGNNWEATKFLSNYAKLSNPVVYGGVEFPSVEQAYVAAKFDDLAMSNFIAGLGYGVDRHGNEAMPAQVARDLGRGWRDWKQEGFTGQVSGLRGDWDKAKLDVMRDLVRQKFENNPEFAKALLATGDQELIEHTTGWNDRTWGMVDPSANKKGSDAQVERLVGENHLGRLLMEQRGLLGGTGLVGRFAPEGAMPEQPAAAMKPTGQQAADGVQLQLDLEGQQTQQNPERKAGDLLPWLLAAGGGGLLGYGVAASLDQ